MKIIKDLTPDDRVTMYMMVNSPIPGRGVTIETFEKRRSLFSKIKATGIVTADDVMDFKVKGTMDLILKNSEWETLKDTFKTSPAASMDDAEKAVKLLERIEEASDYTDKIGQPKGAD